MTIKKLLFCIVCSLPALTLRAQADEYNLKAAFIYNFTQYVDWEPGMVETEFVIGILGPSRVETPLNEIAKTNLVKNKKIAIRFFARPEEITPCNILFISQNAQFPLQEVLLYVSRGTLTISEQPGFAKDGTAFNFVIDDNNKLRFEANLKAINEAGLKAGSQLLKLAKIVN